VPAWTSASQRFVHRDVKPETFCSLDGPRRPCRLPASRALATGRKGVRARGSTEVRLWRSGHPAHESERRWPGGAGRGRATSTASHASCTRCSRRASISGLRRAHRDGEAGDGAPRPLRGFRPEVPVARTRVVHALEKDPQQRYASAAEFVTALVHSRGTGRDTPRPHDGPSSVLPLSTPVPTLRNE